MKILLLLVLIGAVLLFLFHKGKKDLVEHRRSKEPPQEETEADRVRRLVAERKEEAQRKELPRHAIAAFYACRFLPYQLTQASDMRAWLDKRFLDVSKTDNSGRTAINIRFSEGTIGLSKKRGGDFDQWEYASLYITWNDEVVLEVALGRDRNWDVDREEYEGFSPIDINTFKPGTWESCLLQIVPAMDRLRSERLKASENNSEKVNELKKNFKIE